MVFYLTKTNMKWINKHREEIDVHTMSDLYLYNIVKMIYNNNLCKNNPFGDVIEWKFTQPIHTTEYLSSFFEFGIIELKRRGLIEYKKFIEFVEKQFNKKY